MLELDPNDPFDKLIIPIVETNRRKRADYAKDGDIYSNFRGVGIRAGTDALTAIEHLIATKEERLAALNANGRGPANEAVEDTYLDRAVYSILAYGLCLEYAEGATDPNESVAEYIQRTATLSEQEPQARRLQAGTLQMFDQKGNPIGGPREVTIDVGPMVDHS